MKKIEAYIRHEAFEAIRGELLAAGIPSLSITDVKGSGRQEGITESYRGAELVIHLRPKLKIECAVDDDDVATVTDAILRHARTGEVGDGKIFVLDIEDAIRIRTGERGLTVLQSHEADEIPSGG
jgi:nitrogen regulatory protein PII